MGINAKQLILVRVAFREAGRAVAQYVMCEKPDMIHLNLDGTTWEPGRRIGTTWPWLSTERDRGEWAWCGFYQNLGQAIPPPTWARIHRRHGFRRIVTLWASVIAEAYGESLPRPPHNGMMRARPVEYFMERGNATMNEASKIAKNYLVRGGAEGIHSLTWGKFKFQYPEEDKLLYSENMTPNEQQAYFTYWKAMERLREAWEAFHVDPKAAKLARRLYPVAVQLVQHHLDAIAHLHRVLVKKWPLVMIRGIVNKSVIVPSKQVQEVLDDFYARRSQF